MPAKKKANTRKAKVKVRDMKPKKDAKGGLLPAVRPTKILNFTRSK
jgi:hypothetical protein